MKKYFLFIAMVCILIIAIFSCRKSIEPEANPTQVMTPSSETELKIQSFLNRLHSDLKDETTYSIEDAIWYSTAVLNYTYAIYDSSFLHTRVDTSTFSVRLDKGGKVTESDLEDLIETMTDSLEAFFEDLPVNTKHVMLCMAYETNSTEESLNLGLVSVVGYGFSSTYYGSFGTTDHWFSVLDSGKCGQYHGQNVGQDAGDQLEQKIMQPLVQSDPNVRIYSNPLVQIDNIVGVDYPYPNAPRDYRIYYKIGSYPWPGPECLDPVELNFYLSSNGIPYVIDDLQPNQMEFIQIIINGDVFWNDPSSIYEEAHWLTLIYGDIEETVVPASQL